MSSSYTTPATTAFDDGSQFAVVVRNSAGSVTSSAVTLTVDAPLNCLLSAPGAWTNTPFPLQTARFTATYDATPGQENMDGVVGFSFNAATGYTSLAAITRFADTGLIDVRNGAAYSADMAMPYIPGLSYHFRLVIDPTVQRYSAYVTPAGGTEVLLANDYAFRSEQSSVSSLNNWGMIALIVSQSVCNMAVWSTPAPAVAPSINTQPASQTVTAGQTATFSVTATGTAPLSYQWKKNGTAIGGASSASYTTPATTASDSGAQFTVTVSNSAGSVTSNAATLTVNASTMQLTANPSSLSFGNVDIGSSSTLPVTLTNSGNANVTISNVSISGPGFNASGVSTGQIVTPGQYATLNVTFAPAATGSAAGSVTVTSDATNSPTTISLSGSGVQPPVSTLATLAWNPSTSVVVGYNVYYSMVSGGPYTKLTETLVSTSTYTDDGVQSGETYYYAVTSVDSDNVESFFSNEASSTIP